MLCNGGEVKDIKKHFIIECEEFEQYRCELLGRTRRVVGAEEWVNEYEECDGGNGGWGIRACMVTLHGS